MSKFSSFAEYPPRSLAGAEAALLTAWASLERFHNDLVLVGGLAVRYLTKQGAGLLPGPVTMDVDFGVTLAAEGGQYGSMADDLSGQGFKLDEKGRYVRQFETMPVFIDFLTEHPTATTGTIGVDGVPAGVFPGVARALATRRKVTVEGKDLFGATQKVTVPVSGIGALLVLKLNAFAGRQQAKDAPRLHRRPACRATRDWVECGAWLASGVATPSPRPSPSGRGSSRGAAHGGRCR